MGDHPHKSSKRAPLLAWIYGVMVTSTLIAASTAVDAATQVAQSKTHIVKIEGMSFKPEALVVQRGDRIRWVNNDLFPHSATSTRGDFDSKGISPNASWTYLAKNPGDYPYSCSFHPTMKATLRVK